MKKYDEVLHDTEAGRYGKREHTVCFGEVIDISNDELVFGHVWHKHAGSAMFGTLSLLRDASSSEHLETPR